MEVLTARVIAALNAAARIAAATGMLAFACVAAAAVPGALFEHGDIVAGEPGEPIHVRSGLLQLELAPGVVASAGSGTVLQVHYRPAAPGEIEFTVIEGSLRIVRTGDDRLLVVGPGAYALESTGGLLVRTRHAPPDSGPPQRQEINLADSILLRQNQKLQLDTRTFVRSIFGIFGR